MKKKAAKKEVKKQAAKKINYDEHWVGMPEFNQPDKTAIKSVTVNFESKEDMLKFSKLVGQEVTSKTRSIWYPKVYEETALDKRWSDKTKKK